MNKSVKIFLFLVLFTGLFGVAKGKAVLSVYQRIVDKIYCYEKSKLQTSLSGGRINMKKILIIVALLCSIKITYSQGLDTIPLRSIYINEFCLGDSVNRLFKIFGTPQKTEMEVIDEAIENTQPSKNIYYYGKFAYFTEPYEISEGRVGEFCNLRNDSVNMELRIALGSDTVFFKVGDSLNIIKLQRYFPNSFKYMKEKYLNHSLRATYLYLIPSKQNDYFLFPYPFITDITIMYLDNILISFRSNYFYE